MFPDRRTINPILEKATPLRDSRIERRNSGSKILRSNIIHQDSLEDVPDISNNNQDVSFMKKNVIEVDFISSFVVHC